MDSIKTGSVSIILKSFLFIVRSIKSSEAAAKRRKDAEDSKQNEKTTRISNTLSPEKPSSMEVESGRPKVIPGNEQDSGDIMGEEKGLEYFLG